MALIDRAAVQAPATTARELVPVASLGGEVIVTELLLDARLDFEHAMRQIKAQGDGRLHAIVPHLLALAVVLEDDRPLYSVAEWRAWGARHQAESVELFLVAMRLSGLNADDAAKN